MVVAFEGYSMIRIKNEDEVDKALATLMNKGGKIMSLVPHKTSLEEIFLSSIEEKKNE